MAAQQPAGTLQPAAASQRLLPGAAPAWSNLQKFLREADLPPEEMHSKLTAAKATGRAAWWAKFKVVNHDDPTKLPSGKQAMLQCIDCLSLLSGINPAAVAACHFDNKTGTYKKHDNINVAALSPEQYIQW
jgi:hypothetical protein